MKYWLKIVSSSEEKLTNIAYRSMLQSASQKYKKSSWASSIEIILSEAGFNFVWLTQGVINVKQFLKLLEERLMDIHVPDVDFTVKSNIPIV